MSRSVDDFRTIAPPPAPPKRYRFPHIVRETLANGLRVLITENHTAPLVSVRGLVRAGADRDGSVAGLAVMTADLLDEGAGDRDAIRLAEDIGLLGASLGAGADWDASYASIESLSRTAGECLAIFAEVLQKPSFPPAALERLRRERLTEILQQRDEPGAIAAKRFSGFLYGGTSYGQPVIGTAESVSRIMPEDIDRFYRSHYLPNNSSIIVSGDIEPEAIAAATRQLFGGWQPGGKPAPISISPPAIKASRIYLIDRPQAVQSEIRVGHVGVARSTEDYFPLLIMNALLGGVFNSRINLNLRERHGYTYGARSSFSFRRHAGPFVVSAPVRNEVTRESIAEIFHELRRIRTGDIEDGELADTKNYLMGVFPATVQTSSDLAGRLADMELYDLPADYFDKYRERIDQVGREDIARVAGKYIDPDRLVIIVVGAAATVREPLMSLGVPLGDYDVEGQPIS
jgi:zinc protease